MSKFMLYLRHAVALIREDKLFSAIYVAGTAVAIASAMVIAIFLNIKLADIPPETNRSRTLYPLYGGDEPKPHTLPPVRLFHEVAG